MSSAGGLREFADLDQLMKGMPGWESEIVQLSPGLLDVVARFVLAEGLTVLRISLQPRLYLRTLAPADTVCILLVERPLLWCGFDITAPSLILFGPGHEYWSVIGPDFKALAVLFTQKVLSDHPLGRDLSDKLHGQEHLAIPLNSSDAKFLRSATNALLIRSKRKKASARKRRFMEATRLRLLDRLHDIIAPYLENVQDKPPPKRRARHRLARAALAEITRIGPVGTTPADIAKNLGITRRALEQALKSVLGISPAQFLLASRLVRVKNRLMNQGGGIIDTAFEMGFEDPSRFARQYRRLFGERPSESVERAKQRKQIRSE